MFLIIYLCIGGFFAGRYFFNLHKDYTLISTYLSVNVRRLYMLVLFLGPLTMFVGWPLVYVTIFLIAIFNPEVTQKALARKKLLDRARGL